MLAAAAILVEAAAAIATVATLVRAEGPAAITFLAVCNHLFNLAGPVSLHACVTFTVNI